MTTTRTVTRTHTKTIEEGAVLETLSIRRMEGNARVALTIEALQAMIDSNHRTGYGDPVPAWLTPVVLGQLIERGLVFRRATTPETYVVNA